jgi:hypothetical protein
MISPPTGMTTPDTAHTIVLVVLAVVVAAFVAFGAVHWRRSGSPLLLLLALGGLVCSLNEPLVDVLGHCYFPDGDGLIGQRLLGRGIPVWVDLAYVIFFGCFEWVLAGALQRGTARRTMWGAIGAFWALNAVLELPLLGSDLYVYYGEAPMKVGGFPLYWLPLNCLGAFLGAVVVARGAAFFTGRRQLLVVVVPFATYMGSWILDMPLFWALNSDAALGVKWAAAAFTIVAALAAIDALIRLGRSAAPATAASADAPGSRVRPDRSLAGLQSAH